MEIFRQLARPFGFRNRQFETLTEINLDGRKVRIWRTARNPKTAAGFDHADFRAQMFAACTGPEADWLGRLMKLPNVACVAIVDPAGCGVSAYPDWG